MSWSHALLIVSISGAALFIVVGTWPLPKNRRIPGVLKAPDPICRRSDFKIEPPRRSPM